MPNETHAKVPNDVMTKLVERAAKSFADESGPQTRSPVGTEGTPCGPGHYWQVECIAGTAWICQPGWGWVAIDWC